MLEYIYHSTSGAKKMGGPIVSLDLHGMRQEEACVAIDRELAAVDSGTYQIRLIHGYHRGTNLRDMIMREYRHHQNVRRVVPGENQGVTILVIREL